MILKPFLGILIIVLLSPIIYPLLLIVVIINLYVIFILKASYNTKYSNFALKQSNLISKLSDIVLDKIIGKTLDYFFDI